MPVTGVPPLYAGLMLKKAGCQMTLFKCPRSFEQGLLLFLVAAWLVSALMEESTLGRLVFPYKNELYPMSTFSVYLHPKLTGVSVFGFEIEPEPGAPAHYLDAYKLFYPLEAPDLDDEIATNQLMALAESYKKGCPTYQTQNFRNCERKPSPTYVLPEDIGAMWLDSIRHHLGFEQPPYAVRFVQTRHAFDKTDIHRINTVKKKVLMAFYPRTDWRAHDR